MKRTLVGEIGQAQQQGWDDDAIKANAVAVRTFTISPYKSDKYWYNGQYYHCTNAWEQFFEPNENTDLAVLQTQYPTVFQAVDGTENIIMIHQQAVNQEGYKDWPSSMRFGAIEASYKAETGRYTADGGRPWLKRIYDPINSGTPDIGMGQLGSWRWAVGEENPADTAASANFPPLNYLQILTHYYAEVNFVGVTPDPPDDHRFDVLQVEGIDPHSGIVLEKGDVLPGVRVLVQNTGELTWPVNAVDEVTRQCIPPPGPDVSEQDYETLLAHHVYHPGGASACDHCIGLMWMPLCRANTYGQTFPVPPGDVMWLEGYAFFVPNDPAIIVGDTYHLRLDVQHVATVQWTGYPTFTWPAQNIPVVVPTPLPPNLPEVRIDRPPAIVSAADLVNGALNFSWSGVNADRFDLEYRIKDMSENDFPPDYNTILADSTDQSVAIPIGCDQDRRDWEFRLRGRNATGQGEWQDFQTTTKAYPHPWPSYSEMNVIMPHDSVDSIARPLDIINLGGGGFVWTASDDQNWIAVNSYGEGPGSLGFVMSRPGGIGEYSGKITINIIDWWPDTYCSSQTTIEIPVFVSVRYMPFKAYVPVVLRSGQ